MKTLTSIFVVATILLVTACNSPSSSVEHPELEAAYTSPVDYNNTIIEAQQDIIRELMAFGNYFNTTDESAGLEKVRQNIITACDSSIKKVSALKDYDGNTRLRDAALDLFRFYKEIAKNEYKEMQDIMSDLDNMTDEQLDRLDELSEEIGTKEEKLDAELQAAQTEFADKHNFSIYRNELQDEIDAMSTEY